VIVCLWGGGGSHLGNDGLVVVAAPLANALGQGVDHCTPVQLVASGEGGRNRLHLMGFRPLSRHSMDNSIHSLGSSLRADSGHGSGHGSPLNLTTPLPGQTTERTAFVS